MFCDEGSKILENGINNVNWDSWFIEEDLGTLGKIPYTFSTIQFIVG
jgi:hypothetical protein